jgi:hypothetical protein
MQSIVKTKEVKNEFPKLMKGIQTNMVISFRSYECGVVVKYWKFQIYKSGYNSDAMDYECFH